MEYKTFNNHNNERKGTKSRSEVIEEVGQMEDELGKKIDDGIKEAVIMFKLNGFETSNSCEGHIERGYPYPFVDVVAPIRNNPRFKELIKKGGLGNMSSVEAKEAIELQHKLEQEEKEIETSLERLLEEFYKNSNNEKKLSIKKYSSWYNIQPIGAKDFNVVGFGQQLSDSEREKRVRFLDESKKEMDRFVEFLEKRLLK